MFLCRDGKTIVQSVYVTGHLNGVKAFSENIYHGQNFEERGIFRLCFLLLPRTLSPPRRRSVLD